MTAYNGIHLRLPYTGKIIVGNEMKPEFHSRCFTGPHSYAITYELLFVDGTLVESKETSGSYMGESRFGERCPKTLLYDFMN